MAARTATLSRYCPQTPWPKQRLALDTEALELFFGGAAGPGKSSWLLMSALEYVHVPKYAGLILRRDMARLKMAGSIMDRAESWLKNTDAKWEGDARRWRFPSGASLEFGYIDNPQDRFRYQSAEFQFIGLEEATEFRLSEDESNPYLFLFSRLRRTVDNPVPLRFRCASNPGQIGHAWLKRRYIPDDWRVGDPREIIEKNGRKFIPCLAKDNPALRVDEYLKSLSHLPVVTQARLMAGDWTVQEGSLIDAAWFRFWTNRGDYLQPLDKDGAVIGEYLPSTIQRFATVDTAGTSKQKEEERKGKPASWSVIAVWDYHAPSRRLFLRHVWRGKVLFLELCENVARVCGEWRPVVCLVENAHLGPAVVETLKNRFPMRHMPTVTGDMKGESGAPGKVERATPLFRKLQAGEVFFPKYENTWLPAYTGELISWTGLPDEAADQVDVSSYACNYCESLSGGAGGTAGVYFPGVGRIDSLPTQGVGFSWR